MLEMGYTTSFGRHGYMLLGRPIDIHGQTYPQCPSERQTDRQVTQVARAKIECVCGMNNGMECQKQSTLIVTLNEVGDSVPERTSSGGPRMKSMKRSNVSAKRQDLLLSDDQLCFRDP